jgi:hypothetical protein
MSFLTKSTLTRITAGAAMGGAFLLFGGAAAANAEPADGRVDLAIGTAGVLTSVPIETASQIAAGVCDTDLPTIASTAEGVDSSGTQASVCTSAEIGAVDFRQNTAGAEDGTSGVIDAPGTAEGTSYSEEPTEEPAPDVTGDEEPAVEGETPVTTTTVPAPSPVG